MSRERMDIFKEIGNEDNDVAHGTRDRRMSTGGKWRNLPDGDLNITGINFNPRRVTKGDLFIVRNWKDC